MKHHICYDSTSPEDWVACGCVVGRDHSEDECDDENGHSEEAS